MFVNEGPPINQNSMLRLSRRWYAIRDRYDSLVAPVKRTAATPPPQKRPPAAPAAPLPSPPTSSWVSFDQGPESPADARVLRVALVGLANAGKSTLLNALLGTPLAATSARPHTTRTRVLGALTRGHTQVVFVDTPGVVPMAEGARRPRDLVKEPWDALEEAQAALVVVDATAADEWRLPELAQRLRDAPSPPAAQRLLVLNKVDALAGPAALLGALDRLAELGFHGVQDPYLVSALRGTHVSDLRATLVARAVPGPWVVAAGQITDRSLLWRIHEAVRQGLFRHLRQELPYACRQVTVGLRDDGPAGALHVQQELHVPKLSHARTAVGRNGATIRQIADEAAATLSAALGGRVVNLALHLKHSQHMPDEEGQFD